ncbi:YARHG domain-containing protein [Neobacillus drentensis]|uniref:TcaA NTF2-like domain-containing protein n=1 Tax=Neobacillus drentensis TaxID=220684 RepID=UPI002FFEF3DA
MKFEGYEIRRELFSTKSGLKVFEVKEIQSGETKLLRLADFFNKASQNQQDQWYELYDQYQMKVTNFKHLPRVSIINSLDEHRLYTILDCEEGNLLKTKGKLGSDEVSQLIDAVSHLHRKKLSHGSISAENIWLTNQGRVILYGAGEIKVTDKKSTSFSSDIEQLSYVIQNYSSLSETLLGQLRNEQPMTIDELEMLIANGGIQDNNKKRAGLVEKETVPTPTPIVEKKTRPSSRDDHKQSPNERKKEVSPENRKDHDRKKVEQQEKRENHQSSKKEMNWGIWVKRLAIGVVGVLALLFVIGHFGKSSSSNDSTAPVEAKKVVKDTTVNDTTDSDSTNQVASQAANQESETPSVTKEEVDNFMGDYLEASIKAVNQRDFSIVESFIDPNGKSYAEQRDYIKYLEEKNITEELLNYKVNDITKIDSTTFTVKTYEEYNITFGDGSQKIKTFNSTTRVKVLAEGQLAVNELLNLQENKDTSINDTAVEPGDYILPNSDTTILTEEDIANLSPEQLRLARNEIFARHGYEFKSEDLQNYFSQKSWYIPDPLFSESMISDTEKQNAELILSKERK